MISESQERMAAVRPEALGRCEKIDRWELHWAEIGVVTDTGLLRAFHEDAWKARSGLVPHRRVPALRGRAGDARRF